MRIVSFDPSVATAGAVGIAAEDHEMSTWIFGIALACGIWYFLVLVVQAIGFTQLYMKHQRTYGSYNADDHTDTGTTPQDRNLPFLQH
jgi:hypothetical protein